MVAVAVLSQASAVVPRADEVNYTQATCFFSPKQTLEFAFERRRRRQTQQTQKMRIQC